MDKKVDSVTVARALVKNFLIERRDINLKKTADKLDPLFLATLRELAEKSLSKN